MSEIQDTVRTTLAHLIATHDRDRAVRYALEAVGSNTITIPALYDTLADLLVDIGAAWQAGEAEVWQEHYVTAVVRTIVEVCHVLVPDRMAGPNGHIVVLATPPDEYHDLGLRMTADRFELAGWRTHLLGASVPAEQLIAAVRALDADAVVLSASTHFHRVALASYAAELRAALPDVRLWVGGPAFARDAAEWPREELLDPARIPSLADEWEN